jgi:hypothetical protein
MTRTAIPYAPLLLLAASQAHAAAPACRYGGDLAQWAGSMVRSAQYVLVGRVTAVLSPDADHSAQIAVLEVQTPLKGSLRVNRVWNARRGLSFYSLVGRVRVFFVDGQQTIVGCSDYPDDQTGPVLREVERALRGSAT